MLQRLLLPLLLWLNIPVNFVLPALVKCVAGGTAYFGVISELVQQGKATVSQINASAGLLVQTFVLPGIGIFLGVSSLLRTPVRFAAIGAIAGIAHPYRDASYAILTLPALDGDRQRYQPDRYRRYDG